TGDGTAGRRTTARPRMAASPPGRTAGPCWSKGAPPPARTTRRSVRFPVWTLEGLSGLGSGRARILSHVRPEGEPAVVLALQGKGVVGDLPVDVQYQVALPVQVRQPLVGEDRHPGDQPDPDHVR